MVTAHKTAQAQAQAHELDLSLYDVDDLLTMREIISDEIALRKEQREERPSIATQVKVLWGPRKGQVARVVLHMSNDSCLVQFPRGGLARVSYEHVVIVGVKQ